MKWVLLILILSGCGQKSPHNDKTWLSVTSPPMQVVVFAEDDVMDINAICKVIRESSKKKYKDYDFNPTISISASGEINKHESDSDVKSNSRTVSVPLPN